MNENNLLDSEELRKNLTFFENTILTKMNQRKNAEQKKGKQSSNYLINYTFVTKVEVKHSAKKWQKQQKKNEIE